MKDDFEFRSIRSEEANQVIEIEQTCFPPHEACSADMIRQSIQTASDMFLVAIDEKENRVAGLLYGVATDDISFRDEYFTEPSLQNPKGDKVMILGLEVLPQYRGKNLARELVEHYVKREREQGRKQLILTCLESKIKMYEKMGFHNNGLANSNWGQEKWYEMTYFL